MPIYVYKFTDTGETIEVHQAFTDDALTDYPHPSDGTVRPVKKVFQPVGVTFKGGGFYKTDSRGGSSSTTPSTSTTAAGETSSTATPAATPATPSPTAAPSSAPSTPA
jgi:predicted nucleic acid-binding Zn ribbon protein